MAEIKLLVEGGNMKPGPAVGQKLGPLGINVSQVISKVNVATKGFKGMKVPVTLKIDSKKNIEVEVSTPPTLELIKKETGLEKLSGQPLKEKVANLSIEQIISVAKTKQESMLIKDFKSAVKSIVGSCVSAGVLIENKGPKIILRRIDKSRYDAEINNQKIETSSEKREMLDKFLKDYQEKLKAEAKPIKEEKKEEIKEGEAKEEEAKEEGKESEEKKKEVGKKTKAKKDTKAPAKKK